MYKLLPAQDGNRLFFCLDAEAAKRHGAIGYLRGDFGKNGKEFWTTWSDNQSHLKTEDFKYELDNIINALREDGQEPLFAERRNLKAFCAANPGKEMASRGYGYMIRTLNYSYYFRCLPCLDDYDIYCFVYDNRWLLPELAENELKKEKQK